MSLIAIILIFASASLHATWHFMVKQSKPVHALFIPISGTNWVLTFLFAATASWSLADQPLKLFLCAAGGGIFGVVCNLGLSTAYKRAEVSLAYPLGRALPVILTMVITSATGLGKPLSVTGVIALLIIFSGCLIMPMDSFSKIKKSDYINRALPGILCAAAGTTGYTICDSIGVKLFAASNPQLSDWQAPIVYSNIRESFLFVVLVLTVLAIPEERKNLKLDIFKSWKPYCAGIFAGTAYALILAAMPFVSNVSYVQAFRQVSLPISMLLGIIFLHEKSRPPKYIGMLLIVSGMALAALK